MNCTSTMGSMVRERESGLLSSTAIMNENGPVARLSLQPTEMVTGFSRRKERWWLALGQIDNKVQLGSAAGKKLASQEWFLGAVRNGRLIQACAMAQKSRHLTKRHHHSAQAFGNLDKISVPNFRLPFAVQRGPAHVRIRFAFTSQLKLQFKTHAACSEKEDPPPPPATIFPINYAVHTSMDPARSCSVGWIPGEF